MLCGPRGPLTLVADLGVGQVMYVWRGYERLELLGHDFHLDSTRRPCGGSGDVCQGQSFHTWSLRGWHIKLWGWSLSYKWRPQDIGDAKTMRYLLSKMQTVSFHVAMWTAKCKATRQVELTSHQCACIPDVGRDATRPSVYLLGCPSLLGICLSFSPKPPIWYGNASATLLGLGNMSFIFDFTGVCL